MQNPFHIHRAHGVFPPRFLNLTTGDGILAVDVQAALERIGVAGGLSLGAAEREAGAADLQALKRPRAARELYAHLRSIPGWEKCPHGYATVTSLSAAGPQHVGPFLVRAPWHAADPSALDILIEPGLSFGLGTHATTRLPLRRLAQVFRPGMRGADVGCGSGILAIAMARLGAAQVEAVDRDPPAVAEARDNIQDNGVADVVHPIHEGSAADLDGTFDIITANMGGAPSVIEIAPDVAAHLAPGGLFLASGIYGDTDEDAQRLADGVVTAVATLGFVEERRGMERQCVGLAFRRGTCVRRAR